MHTVPQHERHGVAWGSVDAVTARLLASQWQAWQRGEVAVGQSGEHTDTHTQVRQTLAVCEG